MVLSLQMQQDRGNTAHDSHKRPQKDTTCMMTQPINQSVTYETPQEALCSQAVSKARRLVTE